MIDGALVLEGGSLRCLFTAGVLDVLMEEGIDLSYVIGVSAGCLCGLNYVTKQIGRTAKINLDYANDKRYMGLKNLIQRPHSFINFDFLFGEITDSLNPLDKKALFSAKNTYMTVVTNCVTGEVEYIGRDDYEDLLLVSRASCSMPILSPKVQINDNHYLDGGIAMPIPYQKALDDGNHKVVVILTREQGYRKKEDQGAILRAYRRIYRKYPKLLQKLENIPNNYNKMQEELDQLEKDGKIFIIRPKEPVLVSRMEKDVQKLQELYEIGRGIASDCLDALKNYLEIKNDKRI